MTVDPPPPPVINTITLVVFALSTSHRCRSISCLIGVDLARPPETFTYLHVHIKRSASHFLRPAGYSRTVVQTPQHWMMERVLRPDPRSSEKSPSPRDRYCVAG